MPAYASHGMASAQQPKQSKQKMAEIKLQRLKELNNHLREELERERIPVSEAAMR
jgi:guanine nucleotide-binding protein subunit gamma